MNTAIQVPEPVNEPVQLYATDDPARAALKAQLEAMRNEEIEIAPIIAGKRVSTGNLGECVCPHDHGHRLARFHRASAPQVEAAIKAALAAQPEWATMPWRARAAIFLRAAELLATKYRASINAATMLGQSKTAHQAEIDAACELIDFLRFNVAFANRLMGEQPLSADRAWNLVDYRPLEGFVFAVTPFNFTAIAGNLPSAPAMLGNTVVWKPASTALCSGNLLMQIFEEAGLPPGVINFLPGAGPEIGTAALPHPHLAGVHFTGSTATFQTIWRTIGEHIADYRTYPRIVGETGGKDFIVAHPSADPAALMTAIIRGAYEFQGQKCSAASRLYIASSLWSQIRDELVERIEALSMGSPLDFRNFLAAVIDRAAYDRIKGYIDFAAGDAELEVLAGGQCDAQSGYFIRPTLVESKTPRTKLMEEEIFGPVLTAYVYDDRDFEQALTLCDKTSPYALTGAIWARDRQAIERAQERLRQAAGNFYINDKPTGSVVGQQPFGGARGSGTNDKAGSMQNLLRWVSARTVKENFAPPEDPEYPFMEAE